MAKSTKRSRQSLGPFMEGPEGPMDARSGSQYFQQAIDYFRDKVNVKGETWDALWRGQNAPAFTVAGAMKDDLLCDLRKSVDKVIAQGMSLREFRDDFKSIVAKHGWTGFTGEGSEAGMAWRAKVIYDTNLRQAYNAGRWQQLQQFPVWVYRHGDSRSPRPEHLSWNGVTLSRDDPWWQTHFPQNGWGCKCRVEGYSKVRAKLNGIEVGEAPDDGHYEYLNKKTGEVSQVPKGIDPGFDYSVGEAKFGRRLAEDEFAQWQGEQGNAWQSLTPGNWKSAGRPERLVPRGLPQPLQQPVDQAGVIAAVRSALGGNEALITTPVGTVLVDAAVLGQHIAPERTAYLPLLMDALMNPQEIWQSFEQHTGTGKVVLRTRFITLYQVRKGHAVLVAFNAVRGVLTAWTLIGTSDLKYVGRQRVGQVIHIEDKALTP